METAAKVAGAILGLAILFVIFEGLREYARRNGIDPVTRIANMLPAPAPGGGGQ